MGATSFNERLGYVIPTKERDDDARFIKELLNDRDRLIVRNSKNLKVVEFLSNEIKSLEEEVSFLTEELRKANNIIDQYQIPG